MATQKHFIQATVSIKDLTPSMIILEFINLNRHPIYQKLNTNTLNFVQNSFKEAKVKIIRHNEKMALEVKHLKEGDTLLSIYQLPPSLKKLTIVSEKLVNALRPKGFLEFKVKKPVNLPSGFKKEFSDILKSVNFTEDKSVVKKQKKYQQQKLKAAKIVRDARKNVDIHKKASDTVENFMDNAREGTLNRGEVVNYVEKIAEESSSDAIAAMISLKESDQTYAHCVDVGAIFQSIYPEIIKRSGHKFIFKDANQPMLGAFLHDLGKSTIPKSILDSTQRFNKNSKEMQMMRSHPAEGARLLTDMKMSDSIVNMAHYHHVKQDITMNSSYPENANFDDVIFETRLLAITDSYQALVGKRKYKKSWTPPAAIRYLDALAGIEYDLSVWELFLKTMGIYPKGSLVELTDGTLGFVMNVPKLDLERPDVAVICDKEGEMYEHHTLIDLEEEKDISIIKDQDPFEMFGDKALEIFLKIKID